MNALDHANVVERDVQSVLLDFFELTAAVASESERFQSMSVGSVKGMKHVRAVA